MLSLIFSKHKLLISANTAKHYPNKPTFIGYTHSHSTRYQWTFETPQKVPFKTRNIFSRKKTQMAGFTGAESPAFSADQSMKTFISATQSWQNNIIKAMSH